MRRIDGEQVLVRIYLGESKRGHHEPLYRQLLELFRDESLAGATVLKGWAGYGPDGVVHTADIEALAADLPVVIETVDTPLHVEQLLGKIDALMTGGVVMTERARVVRYSRGVATAGPGFSRRGRRP
jgi:PII-like signaling protein